MLFRSINMQLQVILEKRVATSVLFLLFSVMLINYFTNVFTYNGKDVIDVYNPMQLLTLSSNNESGFDFYIMQFYPLLVVIPAGFSLFSDKHLQQYILIQSRVGYRNYLIGKVIVVFLVTFFVFTTPFIVEVFLNMIAFPRTTFGDVSHSNIYEISGVINNYLLSGLYVQSPYLYAIFFIIMYGVFSGVLAIFTVAISTFSIKYKVLLFLPVYILLYLIGMLKTIIPTIPIETNYFFYLRFYEGFRDPNNSLIVFFYFILILFTLSVLVIILKLRKDPL